MQIEEVPPPPQSLIAPFAVAEGHYADAFVTSATQGVAFAEYVEAFYTTRLFKLERLVLSLIGARSTDAEARELAKGLRERFAAWDVAGRGEDEILMRQRGGPTKSWLALREGKLWFGSVVVPVERRGRLTLGPVFHSLVGAHKVYSRLLLSAAVRKVQAQARG